MVGSLSSGNGGNGDGTSRSSRRAALRLFGGSAGAGALLAAGAARPGAWGDEATAAPVTQVATPVPPAEPVSLFYGLSSAPPVVFASGASVQFARASDFPALSGMSLAMFETDLETAREMHWHNNASELGWCLGGTGEMVIVDDGGSSISFALGPDTVFFAPKGLPHAFWPTGDEPLRFLLGFDHQQPATSDFSQLMSPLPAAVIAQAAGVALGAVPSFPTTPKQFAAPVPGGVAAIPAIEDDPAASRFAVRIADLTAETYPGGSRNVVTPENILTLNGINTTLMTLDPGGTRQPHWHPGMDETCFVLEGQVEVGIVGPTGASQTEVLSPGGHDLAFVPENWLHYIANVGDSPARVILFHDAATERAIELSWTLAGFPAPILAASYGMDPAALEALAGGDAPLIAGPPA